MTRQRARYLRGAIDRLVIEGPPTWDDYRVPASYRAPLESVSDDYARYTAALRKLGEQALDTGALAPDPELRARIVDAAKATFVVPRQARRFR